MRHSYGITYSNQYILYLNYIYGFPHGFHFWMYHVIQPSQRAVGRKPRVIQPSQRAGHGQDRERTRTPRGPAGHVDHGLLRKKERKNKHNSGRKKTGATCIVWWARFESRGSRKQRRGRTRAAGRQQAGLDVSVPFHFTRRNATNSHCKRNLFPACS